MVYFRFQESKSLYEFQKWREKWYHFCRNGTFEREMIKTAKKMVSFLYIKDRKMKFA